VLAQRLVRTLCPDCKSPVDINPESWKALGVGDTIPMPTTVYVAGGCLECRQTGYRGRSGVYELMPLNSALQMAVGENPDLTNLRQLAVAAGMHPLRHAGAAKVIAGLTTVEEILALTPDPTER
jgi:general secretion pathway protein E